MDFYKSFMINIDFQNDSNNRIAFLLHFYCSDKNYLYIILGEA